MRLKGPRFPSYDYQQNPGPRKQWIAHTGRKARVRYLRQSLHSILNSKVGEEIFTVQKVRDFIPPGPYAEYGVLMILFQAKEFSDSTEITFAEAVDVVLENVKVEPIPQGESDDKKEGVNNTP